MNYRIDALSLRDGTLVIEGWAIGANEKKVKLSMTDLRGNSVACTAVERDRVDVMQQFGADRMCGFTVAVPFERGMDLYLVMTDGPAVRRVRVNEAAVAKKNSIRTKRSEKLLALCHLETLQVAWDFYKENGLRALWKKSVHKIAKIDEDYDYGEWEVKTRLSTEEITRQKEAWKSFEKKPLISVVIPAFNTGEEYLRALLDSLRDQTYPRLEVIVADGSTKPGAMQRVTLEYAATVCGDVSFGQSVRGDVSFGQSFENMNVRQERSLTHQATPLSSEGMSLSGEISEDANLTLTPVFKYLDLGGNRGIAGNTNAGLEAATGDYIALCDHDDELPLSAFFAVVKAINGHPDARFIYTDEDKIDFDGKAVFEPHFKSDYNPELLTSVNYICHLSVIRRDLLEKVGGFRPEFDGAQDFDFFLRCTEEATGEEEEKLRRYRAAVRGDGSFGQTSGKAMHGDDASSKASVTADRVTAKISCLMDDASAGGAGSTGDAPARNPEKKTSDKTSGKTSEELQRQTGLNEAALHELSEGRFTSETVIHVPEICYHWRYHKGSTAENPASKLYAFEAGSRAVKAHYDRLGLPYTDVEKGVTYGYYHTVPTAHDEVKVSVIIPNKDHAEDLDKCIRSIVSASKHTNIEFIVVENNSTEEKTFDYYRKIQQEFGDSTQETSRQGHCLTHQGASLSGETFPTVKVVRWEREFNYSAINNFGARYATGDVLLLLNNDVEIISPDAVTELIHYAVRPEIGAVGARLNYGDDTIQHAGVIVGLGGIAGAAFVGLHEKENSYMHRMMCTQDYSAVTAACLMLRREVFEEVGGLTEDLAVAFNDIDLCMKIRARGYRVVYDAYSVWHHYESKSRGLEDTPEKVRRFNGEIATFAGRWQSVLDAGDPYYNKNLTLRKANFALKDLMKEKIGEPYKLELNVEEQLKIVEREKQRRGLK